MSDIDLRDKTRFMMMLGAAAVVGALIVGAAGLWLARGNAILLDMSTSLAGFFCL